MVQVLDAIPTFGQSLVQTLSTAGADVAKGLQKRSARKELEELDTQSRATTGQPKTDQLTAQVPDQTQPSWKGDLRKHQLREELYGKEAANLAFKSDLQEREFKHQEHLQDRKVQNAIRQKEAEKNIGAREEIQKKRLDLKLASDAVQSGDTGAFSLNSFADLLGPAGVRLKSAKGAQLDAATKSLLFDSINDVTAKGTNLWLEKVALSALPGLGKSQEANETLITIAQGKLDIQEKQMDLKDDLLTKYADAGIQPPHDLDRIVNQLLKPYAEQVEEKMAYDTRVLYEKEKGTNSLKSLEKVPKGTPLTRERAKVLVDKFGREKAEKLAVSLGYNITPAELIAPNSQPQE